MWSWLENQKGQVEEEAEQGVADRRHRIMEWRHFPLKWDPGKDPGNLDPGRWTVCRQCFCRKKYILICARHCH